jgi:hypothetical protein
VLVLGKIEDSRRSCQDPRMVDEIGQIDIVDRVASTA